MCERSEIGPLVLPSFDPSRQTTQNNHNGKMARSGGTGAVAAAAGGGEPCHKPKLPANPYAKPSSPRRSVGNPYAPQINASAEDRSAVSTVANSSKQPASNSGSYIKSSNALSRAKPPVSNPYAKSPATASAAVSVASSSAPLVGQHRPSSSKALRRRVTLDRASKSPCSEAHAPKVCCKVDKKALKELVAMGFDKNEAKDALLRYDNDFSRAATFLGNQLSQNVPEDYDDECGDGRTVTSMDVDTSVDVEDGGGDAKKPRATVQNQNRPKKVHKVTPPYNATAAEESRTCGAPSTSSSAKRSLDFSPGTKRPPKTIRSAPISENDNTYFSAKRQTSETPNPYVRKQVEAEETSKARPTDSAIDIDPQKTYVLYFDGASKGNPGEAGAGMVLYEDGKENEEVWSGYLYFDDQKTNNEAEYHAVLNGMQCAELLGVKKLAIKGDSQLVVKQLSGEWQCSNAKLRQLYVASGETQRRFQLCSIRHVYRNYNKRADELANIAVRTKSSDLGPADFFRTPNPSQEEAKKETNEGDACTALPGNEIEIEQSEKISNNDVEAPGAKKMEVDADPARLVDQEDALCSALFSQSISSDEDESNNWTQDLPFIVQYELVRYKEVSDLATSEFGAGLKAIHDANNGQPSLSLELISYIYAKKEGHSAPYETALKAACVHGVSVDSSATCLVTFSALLDRDGFHLLPPEPIGLSTRRIYRQYGSHRFLEVRCNDKANLGIKDIKLFLERKVSIAGRQHGLIYSKPSGKTQVYRLFAEKGPGISPDDEISAPQVASTCIPIDLNPALCQAKYMKRMKLVYTDTTPSLTLEAGMLQEIEDILSPDKREMTDGCGLLSREAIDMIYSHYLNNREERENYLEGMGSRSALTLQRCPYSSFQGRLGGMKGMWIVDDRLGPGVIVQFRPSQLKYEVPFTAQRSGPCNVDSSFNAFHHTVEIKEFDKPSPPACLSRDALQILEDRGVPKEYFLSLARKEIDDLETLRSDSDRLLKRYNARTFLKDSHSVFDDDMLHRMLTAGVPLDEPVMQRKVNDFIDKELRIFKEKVSTMV